MLIRLTTLAVILVYSQTHSLLAQNSQAVSLPPKENFHLFLLVGQSNMAGRGKVEPEDLKPHTRVLTLTKDNQWQPAIAPLHFDKPKYVGVGLGRSFGIEIANANPNITVGLIPCAVGGSPIASWEPGALDRATATHPYDDTLIHMQAALPLGTLKAILWHQGESDAKPAESVVYEEKLHTLIHRFRKEFNAPTVPFIAGQMGIFAERPWDEHKKLIDQAHQSLPQKIPHAAFVDAKNLQHKGDEVHFDSPSYRELGRRYAKAYLKLTTKDKN